ncbi:MAG TPA: PAS domain S-box protein, partial [Stellaceae bacterium]|nr:PAS domain S-box protein [Stellaceae bacterium]
RTALQHPDDRARLMAARTAGAMGNRDYEVEARIRRHDGVYRWHLIRNTPLHLDNKTVAWLGTAIDIDDMRQAQQALERANSELEHRIAERAGDLADANARLRLSEKSQRALFANAPVPLHALDADRRIIDVNERWLSLFGYNRDEVIGRPIAEFRASGSLENSDEQWRDLQRDGHMRDIERRFIKKSGETFDAIVTVHLETDANGNFQRTITATIDVTPRRRAEEEARRERQLSELLIESGTDGIVGIDRDFRYTVWNPAMEALSGVPRELRVRRKVFEARPDLATTKIGAAWRATMEGHRTSLRDWAYRFPESGKTGFFDADFAPLYGPDKSVVGGLLFARDTSERRQVEERLRVAQKMEAVGQLTGGVAHDFNNLLTIIMGNLDALSRLIPKTPEAQRMMSAAMRATERGATLTHRLLAFARSQPLEPKPFDVNRLVAGMSDLLRRSLGERIDVDIALSDGPLPCLADPNQLESAILNLAVNARDAMPAGGRLTIETGSVDLDASYAVSNEDVTPGLHGMIAVSDTGVGMSEDVARKAFEPFFTTKEVGHGTGLGLSQVYGFVKQSGGHVKIYSTPREGTSVKIYLPLAAEGSLGVEPIAATEPTPGATHDDLILVVEDDEDVRNYSVSVLGQLGYRVIEASEGNAALRLLEIEPDVRLLFADVGLPGDFNGRQLADEARRRRPGLRVLFTTGYARNAIMHQGRLDPGVELITKPFTQSGLAVKIRRVLDAKPGSSTT